MRIALAQINSWLGDFKSNADRILEAINEARDLSADLVVFSEAAIFGYHPCDLLERPSVVDAQVKELKRVHAKMPKGIAALVGAFMPNTAKYGKPWLNAAVWLQRSRPQKVFAKQLLPTYDVFDESRHIEPGEIAKNVLAWKGKKILVTICEDIWAWPNVKSPRFSSYKQNPLKNVRGKIDLVLNLSASPFAEHKLKRRQQVVASTAKHFKAPMLYVNMVGAQDELIFDGGSFAVDKTGKITVGCHRFQEDLAAVDFEGARLVPAPAPAPAPPSKSTLNIKLRAEITRLHRRPPKAIEVQHSALVLGLRDFVRKNGFQRVHLGLSGGIDSAVVACLAVEALGADHVLGVAMPGPYSAAESLTLARQLAKNLNVEWREVSIQSSYQLLVETLRQALGETPFGVMHENVQARLRAIVLMACANREKSLLLATSNKSELATGYSTIYGDMCGGVMPIGDLLKHQVYALAEYYNRETEVIPATIITRPPSAELRPNQRDQDSLPPYDVLDKVVEDLVEAYKPARSEVSQKILKMMMASEFKRWQAAPILKVSDHAFGRGRRLPLAHKAWL